MFFYWFELLIFIIFAVHIIFDDAWETDKNGQEVPNAFVQEFVSLIPEAAMWVNHFSYN